MFKSFKCSVSSVIVTVFVNLARVAVTGLLTYPDTNLHLRKAKPQHEQNINFDTPNYYMKLAFPVDIGRAGFNTFTCRLMSTADDGTWRYSYEASGLDTG